MVNNRSEGAITEMMNHGQEALHFDAHARTEQYHFYTGTKKKVTKVIRCNIFSGY